jgi:hypothetical protein
MALVRAWLETLPAIIRARAVSAPAAASSTIDLPSTLLSKKGGRKRQLEYAEPTARKALNSSNVKLTADFDAD